LVACANVANLLLARGAARRREIAVRLALGATRMRIIRQLLAESVLLASLGAAAGLALAFWGAHALIAMSPFGAGPGGPAGIQASLDWRVLGFTTALALVTGIAFGLMPALRATRLNLTQEFQGGTRSLGGGAGGGMAKSLMVVQVALSLVLLVGAGLFLRTLRNLQQVDVGFNRERLLLFGLNAGANGRSGADSVALFERLRDRIARVPGVRQTTFARVPPLSQSNWTSGINVPGYMPTTDESVATNGVDPDYFATLEIPLLLGRAFTARDETGAPKVAIVNQAFAKKYFREENVIGRQMGFGRIGSKPDIEIVGLVRDAQYSTVKVAPPPIVFIPFRQLEGRNSSGDATFVVRFTADPAGVISAVRGSVREVDPNLPLFNVRTQQEQIDRQFTQERLFARLCTFFGALALLLAAVGLYGLMSYAVVRRTGEIGLRMALGALPSHVLGMIVRESMGLVLLGVLVGIGAAWGATRWISSMLFGLSATDPITYSAVAGLLLTVAVIACLLPARRAAKVEPMSALRTE
jgi:predicted permease